MARRVIQFPVRNAFAPRAQDSLARDTQDNTQRIVQKVENEIARKAERMNASNKEELEQARSYGVVMMPRTSRSGKFIQRIRKLFSRSKPQ